MIAFSPIVKPHKIVVFVPIEAPFLIVVGIICQSFSVCNFPFEVALGYLSLMNLTP